MTSVASMVDVSGRLARRAGRIAARAGWYPGVPIREGVARGMRISMRAASGDYAGGQNEKPVQDCLAALLAPGNVFFDIGANVGFFSLVGARLVGPSGRVVAFEPVPAVAKAAVSNVRRNHLGNVDVYPWAVGAATGSAQLTLTAHPGGATLADADEAATGRITSAVYALDDLIERALVPVPDLIKIDVEGAEEGVLLGGEALLDRRTTRVICELDSREGSQLRAKVEPVARILTRHGYRLRELDQSYAGSGWHVLHLLAEPESPRSAP